VGAWPEVVKRRVSEFSVQCGFSGRSIYTSQSRINPAAMIPMSLAYRIFKKPTEKNKGVTFEGVVRYSYNHVGALLFRRKGGLIALPVVDDGDLGPTVMGHVFLDWDDPDYRKATITDTLEFYMEYVDKEFSLYPGYILESLVRRGTGEAHQIEESDIPHLIALKLRNGLYIPISKPMDDAERLRKSTGRVVEIAEEEWSINNDIIYDKTMTNPVNAARIEYEELDELFEHLRLTMSNYLALSGSPLRATIQETVMDKTITLSEKRKRLEILLGPIIMNEMMTEEGTSEPTLLRTDCTLKGESDCKGRCAWTKDDKCMLHVGKTVDLGKRRVSVRLLLLRRLNEELIRFSEKRRQIFDQKVSQMAAIDGPITMGSQLIIPEKSMAWFELLRLDWKKKDKLFLEEMSADAKQRPGPPVPKWVIDSMGADPKWASLYAVATTWPALITSLGLVPEKYDISGTGLTREQLRSLVRETGKSVMQLTRAGEDVLRPFYAKFAGVIFIIEGPALIVSDPVTIVAPNIENLPEGVAEKYKKAAMVKPD